MLYFNFISVFHARGIFNIYSTLINAGWSQRVARNVAHNNCKTLLLSHVQKICIMLNCTPNDLLNFTPSAKQPIHDTHALKKLEPKKLPNLQGLFNNCTLDELENLAEEIKQVKKKKAA